MLILNHNQQQELVKSLLYLKMSELKNLCLYFKLPTQGEKIKLIEGIQYYITTGKIITPQEIPTISKAKPKNNYPLAPETFILKNAFKNDLKTRIFLKTLIGNHFHYTAYGIDWIKTLWIQSTPPTYAQFAIYWESEYKAQKITKPIMKPEWAYLNFVDHYKKENPNTSKSQAITAWKNEQKRQVNQVKEILNIDKL